MRVLLDTHVVIWAFLNPWELSRTAEDVLQEQLNEGLVSAASAWEIAIKVRRGRLPGAEALERHFERNLTSAGYKLLPISVEAALLAGRLEGRHRDPLDRMIAAQALELDVPVVSVDARLDEFGVRRIW